ncbi:hypothetical protein BD410DRAFT_786876 [Rickenella mellea]|uniref:Uncharacterized protein n=1 Tax=Rickenella mellea TaxID=50990 RepID=A0A4Y7Q9Z9_9AGAM|nr:hypothetical protein BD410DRAFT_786876 [Rickenella mellea]
MVTPRFSQTQVDCPIEFVVSYWIKPVFILQINEPNGICDPSARRTADLSIRTVIRELVPSSPLPTLDGVCTFGTKLCFYRADQQAITLPFVVEGDHDKEANLAPLEHWNCDILEQKGADQLKSVADQLKEECKKTGSPW